MSADRRGIDKKAWARVRRLVFQRDGYRCVDCGGIRGRLECDHVVALWIDPNQDPLDLDGLATRCRNCHLRKTMAERGQVPDAERMAWRAEIDRLVAG